VSAAVLARLVAAVDVHHARVFKRSTGIRRHATTGRGKGRKAEPESGNDILEVPPPPPPHRSQLPAWC